MTRARARVIGSEHGAVFVQVGIALFVLMAFNVFVLDYGMMWIGRRQVQNAADAGAISGAIALAYDDYDGTNGIAQTTATKVANANRVWNQAGKTTVTFSCPAGVSGTCVRVDVYRNGENGSTPLPTLFGPILGITNQGVRATATGTVASGNATNCLRPIAFPDDWLEQRAPNTGFDAYDETTGAPLSGTTDVYTAPSATQTGRTVVSVDIGERIVWQLGADPLTSPITRTSLATNPNLPTLMLALTLPSSTPLDFQQNVNTCSGQLVGLGDTLRVDTTPPPSTTFNTLLSQDPGVTWNEGDHRIDGSCAPGCASISPRLIPVALFDPDRFQRGRATGNWIGAGCPSNNPCITVTNIVGFFVHGASGPYGPHGHILRYPGMTSSTAPTFVDDASWLVSAHLIR